MTTSSLLDHKSNQWSRQISSVLDKFPKCTLGHCTCTSAISTCLLSKRFFNNANNKRCAIFRNSHCLSNNNKNLRLTLSLTIWRNSEQPIHRAQNPLRIALFIIASFFKKSVFKKKTIKTGIRLHGRYGFLFNIWTRPTYRLSQSRISFYCNQTLPVQQNQLHSKSLSLITLFRGIGALIAFSK